MVDPHNPQPTVKPTLPEVVVDTRELFQGARELWSAYRLRITRRTKLILEK